jgi:hypothetical protein
LKKTLNNYLENDQKLKQQGIDRRQTNKSDTMDESYKKLKKHRLNMALNKLFKENEVENTYSFSKVRKVIFSEAQKFDVKRQAQKGLQMQVDERAKKSNQVYFIGILLETDLLLSISLAVIFLHCILIILKTDSKFIRNSIVLRIN